MQDELERLFELVSRRSGSALSRQQRERVAEAAEQQRAGRPLSELLERLDGPRGTRELLSLLAAVSVHKTDLFRDEAQLDALEQHVLQPLALTGRPLSVWSAGCATGEEVATLLLLLVRVGADPRSTVLGTDLSATALERARLLTFSAEAMRRVPAPLRERFFTRSEAGFTLAPSLAERARFQQHNLVEQPYPLAQDGGPFDVIVCRNVLIYFTPEAADRTLGWLAERLKPTGTLVLSTAEPVLKPRTDLESLRVGGAFFYVPRGAQPAPSSLPPRPSAPGPATRAPRFEAPAPAASPGPPAPRPSAPSSAAPLTPEQEGEQLFALVLDWAAAGQDDDETAQGLRKVLYLAPELAAARYCLGLLLEQRGLRTDAITEYRRALAVLTSGRARPTPFFLNAARLTTACRAALERLGGPA